MSVKSGGCQEYTFVIHEDIHTLTDRKLNQFQISRYY